MAKGLGMLRVASRVGLSDGFLGFHQVREKSYEPSTDFELVVVLRSVGFQSFDRS